LLLRDVLIHDKDIIIEEKKTVELNSRWLSIRIILDSNYDKKYNKWVEFRDSYSLF